jgi:glycine/D-amino acid oxidase-like deaminating enzyme
MKESSLKRRSFLKMASLAATAGTTSGYANLLQAKAGDTSFTPVNVSKERIIRTVVGQRPYRPSGFVLKAEQVGNKTIIHNYGHGGAGVTLSWGTAALAIEEAMKTGASNYAVLGCGAVGLSTARLLQRQGKQVTIYARDLPPQTTSNIAGALWSPVSVYQKDKVTSDFLNQFYRASQLSHQIFQTFVSEHYGVWWIKNYLLFNKNPGNDMVLDGGNELYHDIQMHHDKDTYFGYPYALQNYTMMIDPGIYLNAQLRDFYMAGGKLVVKEFGNMEDISELSAPVIMNCTGLGARMLFNDEELIPVRGQLNIILPQDEIDYSYVAPTYDNLLYMFPRKNEIILGGTSEPGNWSLEPDSGETNRIIKGHTKIANTLRV